MSKATTRALTADERAAALAARVDAARAEVADLTRQTQDSADHAHGARVAADFDTASSHDAETAELRARLAAAEASLRGLETAQQFIAEERRIEQHHAALATAEHDYQESYAEAEELRSRIWPCIKAAQDTLLDALAAERRLQDASARAHELRIALGGPMTRLSRPDPVTTHVVRHPFWQQLQTVKHGD